MRIAAVFLEDQDYRDGNKTINFGGRYNYSVKIEDGKCFISRKPTESFIADFFDTSRTITNISAIVGSNGSGKTTLVYDLINCVQENFQSGFEIWEDDENWYLNGFSMNIKVVLDKGMTVPEKIYKRPATIYYSPYLDHKRSPTGIDLSSDKYLLEDLKNMSDTYDAGNDVNIEDRLRSSTYSRFIKFQKSKYSDKIRDRYGLLDQNVYRVTFTRHRIPADGSKIDFHNTPRDFRGLLGALYVKIQTEYDNFDRDRSSDKDRHELNKLQMKNLILMDLFCLLLTLMEQRNLYLEEGHIDEEAYEKLDLNRITATDLFKFWLQNYYYSKGEKAPLPHREILSILDFLLEIINKSVWSDERTILDWRNKSLYLDENDIKKMTVLNRELLLALPKYYLATIESDQSIYDSLSHLQQYVNFEYASRNLSSGETAMLNLFSRIYDYFEKNILHTQTVFKSDYYVLFLDEADLGYHPEWKRSYVSSILEFCQSFFKELEIKIQIILCTHDPISLSDIPNANITYLRKIEEERQILSYSEPLRPTKSFAANITDLLADSFFLEDALIGDFAKNKIDECIEWLNYEIQSKKIKTLQENRNIDPELLLKETEILEKLKPRYIGFDKESAHTFINLIGEPLLQYKLKEMFYSLYPETIEIDEAKAQIELIARKSGINLTFDN